MLGSWPVEPKFSAALKDIDIALARKFVPEIPAELEAKASGDLSGSLTLVESMAIDLDLSSELDITDVKYGEIETSTSTAFVDVKDLKFDDSFSFQSVDGSVRVTADFKDQNLGSVFETLDLEELQQQYGIVAAATGDVEVYLPLATVENLNTWTMQANATVPQLEIADQQIENVTLVAKLQDGDLILDPVRATVVPDAAAAPADGLANSNAIELSVNWPVALVEGDVEGRDDQAFGERNEYVVVLRCCRKAGREFRSEWS